MKRRIFFSLVFMVLLLEIDGYAPAKINLWKANEEKPSLEAEFFMENPWLLNTSSWSLYLDTQKSKLRRSKLGAFAIGNGRVFTLLGLNLPLHTFHNMTGPTYSSPFFADEWIELQANNAKIDLPGQGIWQVRNCAVVITKETNGHVELFTVNFAPPDMDALIRIIIVRNISNAALKDVSLTVKLAGNSNENSGEILQKRDGRMLSLGTVEPQSHAQDGYLFVSIGDMNQNQETVIFHYLCFYGDEKDKTKTIDRIEKEKLKLLEKTRKYWSDWLSGSLQILSPDEKINDLIEGMKVAVKLQQMYNGAQTPVVKYADRSHDRENVNIARFLLAAGKYKDVKDMMLFGYRAAIQNKEIINSQSILTNIYDLPAEPDWAVVPLDNINKHYRAAERPSWTILQFYWHYKHTNDLELIKKCYGYLKRNLVGQDINEDFLLPFHGDEMYQITFPFYVSKVPLARMHSADSSFAFVAAAEGMQEIAVALGKSEDASQFQKLADLVRTSVNQYYWLEDSGFYAPALFKDTNQPVQMPFADINLKPIWTGYATDWQKEKSNVLQIMNRLLMKDGTLKMSEFADVYHGQIPGLFLYNLSFLDHPHAEKVFNAFHFIADPAGQFAEVHKNNHLPVSMNVDPTGLGKEDARRLGPWEGSVNAYSIIYYLTGMKADAQKNTLYLFPHLPEGWNKLHVKNCVVGKISVEFTVSDSHGERDYLIENKGKKEISVHLTVSLNKAEVKELEVNNQSKALNSLSVTHEWEQTQIKNIILKVTPESKIRLKIKYIKKMV